MLREDVEFICAVLCCIVCRIEKMAEGDMIIDGLKNCSWRRVDEPLLYLRTTSSHQERPFSSCGQKMLPASLSLGHHEVQSCLNTTLAFSHSCSCTQGSL
jgi:hypothetical protein